MVYPPQTDGQPAEKTGASSEATHGIRILLLAGVYFAAGKFDLSLVWPAIGIALTALQDTGSGIPAQDLAHIFKPFFRIDRTRKGSGLGLSIASEIVRMHGGEIIVESEVGSGSTFTVKLPLVQP